MPSICEKRRKEDDSLCTFFDIQDTIEEAEWYHLGTTTRWGNPRHPLYLKGDSEFQWFSVFDYACECRDGDIW